VLLLLVLNAIVFAMWLALGVSPFMTENFLVSADALEAGRWWTLLTSAFSHVLFIHFLLNMYVLATFGAIVEHFIGSARFLVFYLAAAVVASASHAGVSAYLLDKPELPALGASGGVSGVVILFSLMIPRARILLLGLIPMPAIVGAAAFVAIDLIGLMAQTGGGGLPIGHGAHLGGAAVGALFFLLVVRGMGVTRLDPTDYGDVTVWRRLIEEEARRERER
jgi:membrane associated rhomboid family serine protease